MFLTLNEYLLGARKLLSLYGYQCHKNDEDAISYVASFMMKADETWNGRSSRNTWRFNRARFAIMRLKTKHNKRRKLVSLNTVVNNSGKKDTFLSDIIQDKKSNQSMEIFGEVMDCARSRLSQRQFECIRMYYQEDMNMDTIGSQLGITKQAVSLSIRKGILLIQNECKHKIDYTTC